MIKPKNILIVRTDRIGDVILTLPICVLLKKHFPNSRISFLLRSYTKPLAENNRFIDEVITLVEENGKPSFIKNIKQLRNKFDLCIIAYPTFSIAAILFLSKITTRIGTGYRWYSFLFNKRVYEHRKNANHHELEFNIRLLREIGINEVLSPENVDYGLSVDKDADKIISNELMGNLINPTDKIVIIHPGSGGSSVDLPVNKMKELVRNISQLTNIAIFITGNENEKELCQSMVVSKNTFNMAGKLSLQQLIALINKSVLLIANSTGPIHVAAALDKYVIGFYPKIISCSEQRWGPYTLKKKIFTPSIDCYNCTREQCEKLNCMESINIDEVFSTTQNMLNEIPAEK